MDNLVVNAVAPWKGYFHWIGNVREGKSKSGNDYAFFDFTLKYSDHKMQEKYMTFSCGSVETLELLKKIDYGTPLKVYWSPDARENTQNERWYPTNTAYNVSVIQDEGPVKLEKAEAPKPAQSGYAPMPKAPSYPQPVPPMPPEDRSFMPDDSEMPF